MWPWKLPAFYNCLSSSLLMLGHVSLGEVVPLLCHFLVILAAIVINATQIPAMEPFCSVYFSDTAMPIDTAPTSSP